jgi:hypothetical protein
MDAHDLASSATVGRRHEDDAVEAARPTERIVDVPRRVRRRQKEDPLVLRRDSVQLDEKLVDQLTPRARAHVRAASSERVDLVEEEDAGCRPTRLLEELVQVLLALPEPHGEHILEPHPEKRRAQLPGCRARDVCLAAPRRPVQEHASACALAVRGVELGMLKGVDDLEADLLFDVLHSAYVCEGDYGAVRIDRGRRTRLLVDLLHRAFRRDQQIRELGIGELRIDGDRPPVGVTCPVEIALVQEEPALEHERRPRRAVGLENSLHEDCCFTRASEREKRTGEREPKLVRRIERERLSILLERLLVAAGSREQVAQMPPKRRVLRRKGYRLPQRVDRVAHS